VRLKILIAVCLVNDCIDNKVVAVLKDQKLVKRQFRLPAAESAVVLRQPHSKVITKHPGWFLQAFANDPVAAIRIESSFLARLMTERSLKTPGLVPN